MDRENIFSIVFVLLLLAIVFFLVDCKDKSFVKKCEEKNGIMIYSRRDSICLTKEQLKQIKESD